jgi:hypothetical protein
MKLLDIGIIEDPQLCFTSVWCNTNFDVWYGVHKSLLRMTTSNNFFNVVIDNIKEKINEKN